jgi:hypothetical protein
MLSTAAYALRLEPLYDPPQLKHGKSAAHCLDCSAQSYPAFIHSFANRNRFVRRRFDSQIAATRLIRNCVSEASAKETWNPGSFGCRGLRVYGPRDIAGRPFPLSAALDLNPHRGVVTGLVLGARRAIDAGCL